MLGLIAEADETNRSQNGFLDSPVVTLEKARDAVRHLNDSTDYVDDDGVYVYEDRPVPFSFGAKRVFEAAADYSKSLGHNFVDPEHILVAIIKVDDGSSARILYRYNNVTVSDLFFYCLLLYLYMLLFCFWFISMGLFDLQKNITTRQIFKQLFFLYDVWWT
jgi:hypothetical protein